MVDSIVAAAESSAKNASAYVQNVAKTAETGAVATVVRNAKWVILTVSVFVIAVILYLVT